MQVGCEYLFLLLGEGQDRIILCHQIHLSAKLSRQLLHFVGLLGQIVLKPLLLRLRTGQDCIVLGYQVRLPFELLLEVVQLIPKINYCLLLKDGAGVFFGHGGKKVVIGLRQVSSHNSRRGWIGCISWIGGSLGSLGQWEALVLGVCILQHLGLLLLPWVQRLGRGTVGADNGFPMSCLGPTDCWLQGGPYDGVWHGRRYCCHLVSLEQKVKSPSLLSHQRLAGQARDPKGVVHSTRDPGGLVWVSLALDGQDQGISQSTDGQINASSCPGQA